MKSRSLFLFGAIVAFIASSGTAGAETGAGTQGPPPAAGGGNSSPQAKAMVQQYMAGPSVFIQNAGQWPDTAIRFALDGRGANVGITDRGPRFQLFRKDSTVGSETTRLDAQDPGSETRNPKPTAMHEFGVVFDGAAPVTPVGRGKSDRTFNYMMGDVANHRQGVASFEAIWYENLYPGISLELKGQKTGIKYIFHVAPGGDWRAIRVRYDGVDGLLLRPDGALEIRVAPGWDALADGAPYVYQEVNGEKKTVAGKFTLVDGQTCGFDISGAYDATLPLVIDPEVAWTTYLGGTGEGRMNDSVPRYNRFLLGAAGDRNERF